MVLLARSLQEKKERDAAFQKQLAFVRLEREDSKLLRVLLRFDRFTYRNGGRFVTYLLSIIICLFMLFISLLSY